MNGAILKFIIPIYLKSYRQEVFDFCHEIITIFWYLMGEKPIKSSKNVENGKTIETYYRTHSWEILLFLALPL